MLHTCSSLELVAQGLHSVFYLERENLHLVVGILSIGLNYVQQFLELKSQSYCEFHQSVSDSTHTAKLSWVIWKTLPVDSTSMYQTEWVVYTCLLYRIDGHMLQQNKTQLIRQQDQLANSLWLTWPSCDILTRVLPEPRLRFLLLELETGCQIKLEVTCNKIQIDDGKPTNHRIWSDIF